MGKFNIGETITRADLSMLILRIVSGGLMIPHGIAKLITLLGPEPIKFADPLHIGSELSLILTIMAELVCSVFLIIGLWTRFMLMPLIFTMLVAVFVVHLSHGIEKQELGLIYLGIYTALAVYGPGKYSLDHKL